MNFIKVTATPCTSSGEIVSGPGIMPIETFLNISLIASIKGIEISLQNADFIRLYGKYYTNFKLSNREDISKFL